MKSIFTSAFAFLLTSLSASAEDRPNILFCIADDWGWPHASAYENDEVVQTPSFDRIAKEGVLFHHAYISSPSCTPSRNAILTGQYHWRLGPGGNLWSTLRQDLEVYPHLLRDAGYHIGSWRKSWGPGKLDGKWAKDHPAGKTVKGGFVEFLKNRPEGKPFCFWLGASDPHRGYKLNSGRESGMDLSKIKLFAHYPDHETIRGDVADYYFEVQRFDSDVGKALELLEQTGEAENTIVVITGDHGMPFPRCKANLYDCGARVPLAMRWPAKVKGGQVLNGFVSTTDLAPTFLAAAGLKIPSEMTGQSLIPAVTGGGDDALRPFVLTGKERHVPGQEAPNMGGYPCRAIRDHDFLYIRNYDVDRWPSGTPNWQKAAVSGAWLADCDNGPAKTYIVENKDQDEEHRRAWELCFGKRAAEELFDLKSDPEQIYNIAADPEYADELKRLSEKLTAELAAAGDPRHDDSVTFDFDAVPYLGGAPKHPKAGRKKKAGK
ncbi:MAG: sulfatase [Verrucomicrobiales bacterium]|nr:sulfatase [Verrucomicrobiales bacterium]